MSETQILLSVVLFLFVALYVRRKLQLRGVAMYTPAEVAERMKHAALLLDVRTGAERQRNSIRGSLHIPLHELGRRMGELEKHKQKEIICYCQTGNRSLSAAAKLRKAGYRVANMSGGIVEWNSRGLR
jgi:rhodanese-related sulfurtransferase